MLKSVILKIVYRNGRGDCVFSFLTLNDIINNFIFPLIITIITLILTFSLEHYKKTKKYLTNLYVQAILLEVWER